MLRILKFIGAWIVCSIISLWPTWAFVGIYKLLDPEGFWQKFVIYGGGIWIFGTLQLIMLMALVVFMYYLHDGNPKLK